MNEGPSGQRATVLALACPAAAARARGWPGRPRPSQQFEQVHVAAAGDDQPVQLAVHPAEADEVALGCHLLHLGRQLPHLRQVGRGEPGGRVDAPGRPVAAPSRIATAASCCSQAVASTGATVAPTLGWNLTQPSASRRRRASRTGMALTPSSRAIASIVSRARGRTRRGGSGRAAPGRSAPACSRYEGSGEGV